MRGQIVIPGPIGGGGGNGDFTFIDYANNIAGLSPTDGQLFVDQQGRVWVWDAARSYACPFDWHSSIAPTLANNGTADLNILGNEDRQDFIDAGWTGVGSGIDNIQEFNGGNGYVATDSSPNSGRIFLNYLPTNIPNPGRFGVYIHYSMTSDGANLNPHFDIGIVNRERQIRCSHDISWFDDSSNTQRGGGQNTDLSPTTREEVHMYIDFTTYREINDVGGEARLPLSTFILANKDGVDCTVDYNDLQTTTVSQLTLNWVAASISGPDSIRIHRIIGIVLPKHWENPITT